MIFCVEDDAGIREIEIYTLKSTGFTARGFADGAAFFETLAKEKPSLVILDVMLPGEDGVEILKRLKAAPATCDIPVIMATAKGMEYDKVQSLDLGADDYIVKPFQTKELTARINAVCRRKTKPFMDSIFRRQAISLNRSLHSVSHNGKELSLGRKEFELFSLLFINQNNIIPRATIFEKVWNDRPDTSPASLDSHIYLLRKKLKPFCDKIKIRLIKNVGYLMEIENDK